MNLPSKIRGWFNSTQTSLTNVDMSASPEKVMAQYIATGKKQYLSLLVGEFNLALYHYLLSQSDKATAEDVVQITWLKVMKTQSSVTPTHVKSWLFTIARNTLIDELRKQNRWQHIEFEDQIATENSLEQQLETKDKLAQFNQALSTLPFLQKEAFILQQEGFSLSQISDLTSESQETIKSRLRYARNHLKNKIGTTS
ncbi:RNA polymerase sigma factor [Pseudocolwellia agarivorans]|uniref:RNA polymerase sigma factor n=1 Tax=Pseudocolwellia agarivorans TaxID=1911682 RepID=UPI0009859B1D|nr:sigma-70 family RNA polymerase sigma factor [Pseudocolwellia agarivorans]